MTDHADDCAIVTTGVCTCTRGIGQPAAQVTRKMLVDEYQKGREVGYADGFKDGEDAATAKWIAMSNRDSLHIPADATQPITVVGHHRHRGEKHQPLHSAKATDEFDKVKEGKDTHGLNWQDYALVLGLALGFALLVGVGFWFVNIPHWPLWAVGTFVSLFMGFIIKLDYDNRKKHDVH